MSASKLTAVLPARIRARWDRLALEQLALRAADLAAENERLRNDLDIAERAADFWQAQIRRAEDEGAQFAMNKDGQLYRLQSQVAA